MKQDIETVLEYLPNGWEEAARSEGALRRGRKIKTAEELLLLILLYVTQAGSYQNASTLMAFATDVQINKEAARKRIRDSWPWLLWMVRELCLAQGYAIKPPAWLGERSVLLVDASDVALRGSEKSDYRLHYAFDLFGFTCDQLELTTIADGGERLGRYALRPGDIVVADRAYGTRKSLEYVREAGAYFVVRLRTNALAFYDETGKRIDLMPRLRALEAWEAASVDCFYKDAKGSLRSVRVVACRKDDSAAEKEAKRRARAAKSKRQPAPSARAQEMAGYIVVATNLPDTAEQILELYRARWQIEQVFLRLKGLFCIGEPPSSNPDSVKAWFYGKLLVAALCEAISRGRTFSPF